MDNWLDKLILDNSMEHVFQAVRYAFARKGWTYQHVPPAGSRWTKEDNVVTYSHSRFGLNGKPVDEGAVCLLAGATQRMLEVAEVLAPHPLTGKYGGAFMEGVLWTDEYLASLSADKKKSKEITGVPSQLLYAAFESEGWTVRHRFMAGNYYTKGDDTITYYAGRPKLNGKDISDKTLCELLHISPRQCRLFLSLEKHTPRLTGKNSKAFLDGVRWVDKDIADEIEQVLGKKQ